MNSKFIFIILFNLIFFLSCSDDSDAEETKISLNKTTTEIKIGQKETLTATVTPYINETVSWESSDKNVATVFFGEVTAIAHGTTTITAKVGTVTAQCVVTVPELEYQLVWSDEFEGNTLNINNWVYEIGTGSWGWGNDEKQYYTDRPENIRLKNGQLIIEAKKESYEGSNYTSARITTKNKVQFTYGKMEARISLPSGAGTWPAFWMLGASGGWPRCGEIDIMEHVGKDPTMISHALHTANKNGSKGNNWNKKTYYNNAEGDFHIFGMEWVENGDIGKYDYIRFFVDGTETAVCYENLQTDEDWPFNKDFFFVLNLAVGGIWGGTIDDQIFNQPVQMKVDWVKVYQVK